MAEYLAKKIDEHGWIANMPANYAHYLNLMLYSIEGAFNADIKRKAEQKHKAELKNKETIKHEDEIEDKTKLNHKKPKTSKAQKIKLEIFYADLHGFREDCKLELKKPEHVSKYCINNGISYEYKVMRDTGEEECCIPAMTDEGYFIIESEKKVLLIQKVKMKTEHYVFYRPPSCKCNLMGSYNPVKVSLYKCSRLQIDTSMIKHDIR